MVIDTVGARKLAVDIASLLNNEQAGRAYNAVAPVLQERTPFRRIGEIGKPLGTLPPYKLQPFLDRIAASKAEGGWVLIASALGEMLKMDFSIPLQWSRDYLSAAGIWYAADIFGERVPGPALMMDFDHALFLLAPWREDPDCWVRRTVGVAVHYWAKRSRDIPGSDGQAQRLLQFAKPLTSDRDLEAVKGIGWGLKTLGRYFPLVVVPWLKQELPEEAPHARLLLRKALTYLPQESKAGFSK